MLVLRVPVRPGRSSLGGPEAGGAVKSFLCVCVNHMIAAHLYFNKDSSRFLRPRTRVWAQGREGRRGGGLAARGWLRKTGEIVQGREREKEKTLIKLLIHWAPRPQTHWPDCLAGCVCSVCVCVCSSVRSPPPPTCLRRDYLIVSHYPPPPTPWPFPKQKAFPALDPLSSPGPRRDFWAGPGPRPAAEELRNRPWSSSCPPICPPHIPTPLPQHPPLETRGVVVLEACESL